MKGLFIAWTMIALGSSSFAHEKHEGDQKVKHTMETLKEVEGALNLYKLVHRDYPNYFEGLHKLIELELLSAFPQDEWGNRILYIKNLKETVLISKGLDGVKGTGDDIIHPVTST